MIPNDYIWYICCQCDTAAFVADDIGVMEMRVGLIGLGEVGQVHLEAYHATPAIEIVAAAEIRQDRLFRLAGLYGFRPYADHRRMLDTEALDIVCVLTPAALHLPVVADCAAAGVPILTEKPISVTAADAVTMIETCAAARVPLFYGSSYRHLPAVVAARDIIRRGLIGDIVLMRESYVSGAGPAARCAYGFAHYPEGLPGGTPMGLVDHGIHLLDIFPWLADSPVVSAFGRGNLSGGALTSEFAILQLSSGAVCQLVYDDGTWSTHLPAHGLFSEGASWTGDTIGPRGQWEEDPGCIHVHGTAGALRIQHYSNALFVRDRTGVREEAVDRGSSPFHFGRQLEAFAADISAGVPPSTPGEAGLQAMTVLEAIYTSAREGRVVAVPDAGLI